MALLVWEKPLTAPTVIVVDDEGVVCSLVTKILETHGFNVLPFTDPLQALAVAEEIQAVDVLVTDIVMPKICRVLTWRAK